MIEVLIHNETDFEFPADLARQAVVSIVQDAGFEEAEISLAIVDDPEIHRLNRRHLQHDYPTDVLSFVLGNDGVLEGEVIVSADTATRFADQYQWSPKSEILLYVVHGTLHLVGYDDHSTQDRAVMREKECLYLQRQGIELPVGHTTDFEREADNREETSA